MRRGNHELAPVEIVAEEAKQAHVALVESLKEGSISHALCEELSIAERLYVQQRQPLGAPDECDAISLRVTRTLLENALKPGGRIFLLEFRGEDPKVPIKPLHKMTEAQARLELESAGFRFVSNLRPLPWQHFMIFERP